MSFIAVIEKARPFARVFLEMNSTEILKLFMYYCNLTHVNHQKCP